MKNLKKMYIYFSINPLNLVILLITEILMTIIFSLENLNIDSYDYLINRNYYINMYFNDTIFISHLITIIVIISITAIDYMINSNRFDILFLSDYSKKDIVKAKVFTYIAIITIFSTISFLMLVLIGIFKYKININLRIIKLYISLMLSNIEVILISLILTLLTKVGLSTIFIVGLFLLGNIITDYSEILGNLVLLQIDTQSGSFMNLGIIFGFVIDLVLYLLLTKVIAKRRIKLE